MEYILGIQGLRGRSTRQMLSQMSWSSNPPRLSRSLAPPVRSCWLLRTLSEAASSGKPITVRSVEDPSAIGKVTDLGSPAPCDPKPRLNFWGYFVVCSSIASVAWWRVVLCLLLCEASTISCFGVRGSPSRSLLVKTGGANSIRYCHMNPSYHFHYTRNQGVLYTCILHW